MGGAGRHNGVSLEQLLGVDSVLLPRGFQGPNSDHQAW